MGKNCQLTFKQQAYNETVRKCYRPIEKVCVGEGPEECRTVYESSCTTRYVEKQPGKFVGDTGCEKLPVEICGAGCTFEEGQEECHDKVIASLVDVPEEICDLNPQKTCRLITKLVPKLSPKHECTIVPQEVCNLRFSSPRQVAQDLATRWCLDPTPAAPEKAMTKTMLCLEPSALDRDNSVGDSDPDLRNVQPIPGFFYLSPICLSLVKGLLGCTPQAETCPSWLLMQCCHLLFVVAIKYG